MTISNIIFLFLLIASNYLFFRNLKRIISSINLGKDINRSDKKLDRWKNMIRVALGPIKDDKKTNSWYTTYYTLSWFFNYKYRDY